MLKLALTPKWVFALIGCLLLGVVFAALAQWQVDRSVLPGSLNEYNKTKYVALPEIATAGKPFTFQELDDKEKSITEVFVNAEQLPSKAVLINNRFQADGSYGSWIVIPTMTSGGKLFVVLGFVPVKADEAKVLQAVQSIPDGTSASSLTGRYLPSEAPLQGIETGYEALSVAQLVNDIDYGSKASPTFTGFLALTKQGNYADIENLEPLDIAATKFESGLNWLSAFYAIEWTFFALFALFMWWRLLADAYKKQQEALLEQLN